MDTQDRANTQRSGTSPRTAACTAARDAVRTPSSMPLTDNVAAQARAHHGSTHHVTQSPINDVDMEYVTRDRYRSLEQTGSRRLHMGTASSDPSYLPLTPQEQARERAIAREQMQRDQQKPARTAEGHRSLRHSDRYLQTPKPGHSIFTSQRERRARHIKMGIGVIALISVVIALVWFFFLR